MFDGKWELWTECEYSHSYCKLRDQKRPMKYMLICMYQDYNPIPACKHIAINTSSFACWLFQPRHMSHDAQLSKDAR